MCINLEMEHKDRNAGDVPVFFVQKAPKNKI